MFSRIKQKYRKQIRLNEAKRYLREHGYKLLLETPIIDFDPSESKSFLLDVIDNLEQHGYVTRAEIDRLDDKLGYI